MATYKDFFKSNKPKEKHKKSGRKKEVLKKNEDGFICEISISNSNDYTGTKHNLTTYGNIEGINNHFTAWFNFIFHNHYKPILTNKYLPYSNNLNPSKLNKGQNQKILLDNSNIKSLLADRHLLSLLNPSLPTLTPQQINKLTKEGLKEYENKINLQSKLNNLSTEQIEKLLKLIE
jgi:hypothetical protein